MPLPGYGAVALMLLPLPLVAQDQRSDVLAKWRNATRPGVAVAVVRNGQVTLQETLGLADMNTRAPVHRNTRFPIGSISKQFTATAVLMLAADRKLQLDDPASRFVTDLPEYARTITIRQLLHHTGGLPDHEELLAGKIELDFFLLAARSRAKQYRFVDALAALRRSGGLRFSPGEKWEYSNTGYMILGQLIERICSCSYANFVADRIFRPLLMKDSLVIAPPPAGTPRLASAYARHKGAWADISYSPLSFIIGHDGVISTIEDMTRWATAIQEGTLLPAEYRAAVFQSGSTNQGALTQYGYAWRLADLHGKRVVQHEGCWSGYRNGIVYLPEERLSAVVLSNAADSDEFWNCDAGLTLARSLVERTLHKK